MSQRREPPIHPHGPHAEGPGASSFGVRFEVLSQIAVGSTARVDLCRSLGPRESGQLIAVKRLLPDVLSDDAVGKRFLDEVWMTAALRHPNVVSVVGWGHDNDGPYLAVELVQGVSLARLEKSVFETGEQFPERLVVYIGLCVARGLSAAHELRSDRGEHLQLVHRDLTAANVLLGFAGEVKIADFGLAKAKDRLTVTTSELPKRGIGHVAPEELEQRRVDHRSDFFGLGALLFETLTGKPPFRGKDDIDVLQAVLRKPAPDPTTLRPKLDRALAQLVLACLEKEPDARPQTARAIAATLEEWLYKRGYLQDSPEALARFVRRNSMRQMRWFERAILGEPEPLPVIAPKPALHPSSDVRGRMPSLSSASQNETTVVHGGRPPPPPPRRTRASTDGVSVRRRRDSSPSLEPGASPQLGDGVPSMVDDEQEDAPTVALRVDPEMRQQMRDAFLEARNKPQPPRHTLETVRIEDVDTADSTESAVVQMVRAAIADEPTEGPSTAKLLVSIPNAPPVPGPRPPLPSTPLAGHGDTQNPPRKRSAANILEHIENELALLRALARERHELARVARQTAHEAALRADQAEADARAVERAMAGARQAMDLASRGDPNGATRKLEEAFADVTAPKAKP